MQSGHGRRHIRLDGVSVEQDMDQPLAPYTTFGVGGPAAGLVTATSRDELIGAVKAADACQEPVFVLSGGSNVLIGDDGFPGRVVRVATRGIEAVPGPIEVATSDDDAVYWQVAAGEPLDDVVAASVDDGLVGLETLSGIPGLTGAAPVQNVGAYGGEIATAVQCVRVWDRLSGTERVMAAGVCGFGYRDSLFKRTRPAASPTGRFVVLEVVLRLTRGDLSAPVEYAELATALAVPLGARAPLRDVRQAVLSLRRAKGMVYDASDPDTHGAGSFFTNPLLTPTAAAGLPANAPRFLQADGRVKTSAAWLIDDAGYHKGYGHGPARLSSKHVLACTNQGGATAADVIALAREVRDGVRAQFGVKLEPEPVLVGVTL